jgi:hypothetical protein
MTLYKARVLAQHWRGNIGRLLRELGELKKRNPQDIIPGYKEDRRTLLKGNIFALKDLYRKYPAIKPIAVRQLDLFSRSRIKEENTLISAR